MRPRPMKYAVALLGSVSLFTTAAGAAEWNGSYSANGQCFCVGEVAASISSNIVPTPIGGQTVVQVCDRIGAGPGLSKTGGLFNHPVYEDMQCGNGPFPTGIDEVALNCAGSLDGNASPESESCQPVGSNWDLKTAFGKTPKVASAKPAVPATVEKPKGGATSASSGDARQLASASSLTKPVVTTHSVDVDSANGESSRPLRATVISSASTANRKLPKPKPKPAPLPPFTGEEVTIDGQRYKQARDGLDATGGEPGSRIILDGLVFLRDDDSVLPSDLYRVQSDNAEGASKKPAKAKKSDITASAKTGEKAAAVAKAKADANAQATNALIAEAKADVKAQAEAKAVAKAKADERAQAIAQAKVDAKPQVKADNAADVIASNLKIERAQQAKLARESKRLADAEELKQRKLQQAQLATRQAEDQARIAEPSISAAQAAPSANVYNPKDLDTKRSANKRAYQQDEIAIPPSPLTTPAQADVDAADDAAADQVVDATANASGSDNAGSNQSTILSALRLPPEVRASSRNFSYFEALPAYYDIGGGGIVLEGSIQSHARLQYLGRVGVSDTYEEVMLGAGYYLTPADADRFTVVLLAGVEYGSFELSDDLDPSIGLDFSDSGLYVGASTRFVANNRFEMKAGVGYSTFFDGDATIFGGGYYHLTPSLDLVSRFELGDNDLLGIGVRFYY